MDTSAGVAVYNYFGAEDNDELRLIPPGHGVLILTIDQTPSDVAQALCDKYGTDGARDLIAALKRLVKAEGIANARVV